MKLKNYIFSSTAVNALSEKKNTSFQEQLVQLVREKVKVGEGRIVISYFSALQPLLQFLKSVSFHLSGTSYLFYFSFLKKIHVKSYSSFPNYFTFHTHPSNCFFKLIFLYPYCSSRIYQHISIGFNEYSRSLTVDIIIFFFRTMDI